MVIPVRGNPIRQGSRPERVDGLTLKVEFEDPLPSYDHQILCGFANGFLN